MKIVITGSQGEGKGLMAQFIREQLLQLGIPSDIFEEPDRLEIMDHPSVIGALLEDAKRPGKLSK